MPYVQTVTGPIDAVRLGFILPHEHAGIGSYGGHAGDPWQWWDQINDEDLLADELFHFKELGGSCLVDLTNHGLGRNPERIRRLSERTSVPIVMGSGWYRGSWGTPGSFIDRRQTNELADEIVQEFHAGVGETGIKPGVIGEIGTDKEWVNAQEERVFRAVARAARETGLGVMTHAMRSRVGLAEIAILLDEGMDPSRIVIGHVDLCPHLDYYLAMLEQGVSIEMDFLSAGRTRDPRYGGITFGRVHDAVEPRIIRLLLELLERGYVDQLLLSQDFGIAIEFRVNGGHGLTFLQETFLPRLRQHGVDEESIRTMTERNPLRVLQLG